MTAAGWYPDPNNGEALRWWDGDQWTDHVSTEAAASRAEGSAGRGLEPQNSVTVPAKQSRAELKEQKRVESQQAQNVRVQAIQAAWAAGKWWSGIPHVAVSGTPVYLGARGNGKLNGFMRFTEEGIAWRSGFKKLLIPWTQIEALDIDGETTKRVTVTRALTIGVFALGAKKKREDCHLSIITPALEHAFVFEKTPALKIRNDFRPVVNGLARQEENARSQPTVTVTPPSEPSNVVAELAKLAALRESGALSDDEFAAAKARLLR